MAKGFGQSDKHRKVKIGEIAPIIHSQHGRGFFVNMKNKPLVFWKGTPHLNKSDASIVSAIDLTSQYVVVDFPNGATDGFSLLMVCNVADKHQLRILSPSKSSLEQIADGILVFD